MRDNREINKLISKKRGTSKRDINSGLRREDRTSVDSTHLRVWTVDWRRPSHWLRTCDSATAYWYVDLMLAAMRSGGRNRMRL